MNSSQEKISARKPMNYSTTTLRVQHNYATCTTHYDSGKNYLEASDMSPHFISGEFKSGIGSSLLSAADDSVLHMFLKTNKTCK